MAENDCATQGDVRVLLECVVRLETQNEHGKETVQTLFDRITKLESTINAGFQRLSEQISAAGNRRALFVSAGSGIGGGIVVGLYAILHSLGKI